MNGCLKFLNCRINKSHFISNLHFDHFVQGWCSNSGSNVGVDTRGRNWKLWVCFSLFSCHPFLSLEMFPLSIGSAQSNYHCQWSYIFNLVFFWTHYTKNYLNVFAYTSSSLLKFVLDTTKVETALENLDSTGLFPKNLVGIFLKK